MASVARHWFYVLLTSAFMRQAALTSLNTYKICSKRCFTALKSVVPPRLNNQSVTIISDACTPSNGQCTDQSCLFVRAFWLSVRLKKVGGWVANFYRNGNLDILKMKYINTAVGSQMVVSAWYASKQILHFGLAGQNTYTRCSVPRQREKWE